MHTDFNGSLHFLSRRPVQSSRLPSLETLGHIDALLHTKGMGFLPNACRRSGLSRNHSTGIKIFKSARGRLILNHSTYLTLPYLYFFDMQVGSYPTDRSFEVRIATLQDLEDITGVAQKGFPDDPEFDYRFPRRHEYPEDNHKWIKQEYKEYLCQPEKYIVVIVTASDFGGRAVSLSVWDKAVSLPHQGGGKRNALYR